MPSLTFPVLVLAFVCIFHTDTVQSKALSQSRDKRAPNFFAYPRQGRAMNFFSYPRGGKRGGIENCCSGITEYVIDDKSIKVCQASRCCEGLEERLDRQKNVLFLACVPSQFEEDRTEKMES